MTVKGVLDADMTMVGGWIADAARWWLDQLRDLVPPGLRARRRPSEVLVLDRDVLNGQALPGAVADVSGKVVALPPGLCLVRVIERPFASGRDLERMVALDADRLMPLGRNGTIIASRAIGPTGDGATLNVQVAGLARADAERLCHALRGVGGRPRAVLATPPAEGEPAPADLLPALRRAGLLPHDRPQVLRWWLIVLFLAGLNLGLLVWRDVAETQVLEEAVDQQQPALATAQRLRTRIGHDAAIVAQTRAARAGREPLAMLIGVGAALPPGAWLKAYSWQDGMVRMSGFRPAGADVAGALRRSGLAGVRIDEGPASAATPLGQPFQLTARSGGR